MQNILKDVDCLYTVLGLPPRGTSENKKVRPEDITKAYRKLALEFHPDVNAHTAAVSMFQKVSAAYTVLKSAEGRKRYDKDGSLDDNEKSRAATTRTEDWMEVFREMYNDVSAEEVANFFATYSGSEEECVDVISYYERTKGNFGDMVLYYCMFSNDKPGEVTRLRSLVQRLIKEHRLKACEAFKKTSTDAALAELEKHFAEERAKADEEATTIGQEAEQAASRRKAKGHKGDLQLQVFKQNKMDDFLNVLEGKYAKSGSKKVKK